MRRVVELGRQARSSSGIKLRQPLRRLVVEGASLDGHLDEVADELRVKDVELGPVEAVELQREAEPAGAGARSSARSSAQCGRRSRRASSRSCRTAGSGSAAHELAPDEVLVERGGREGWAVASGDGVTVALDLGLDDELVLEGEAYELIHHVNSLRKERGLELTDRIALTVPEAQRELADRHGEWISREVLATSSSDVAGDAEIEKS